MSVRAQSRTYKVLDKQDLSTALKETDNLILSTKT